MDKLISSVILIVGCSVVFSSVYLYYPNYCDSIGQKSDNAFSCRELVSIQQKDTRGLILTGIQNDQIKNQVFYNMYQGEESSNVLVKVFDNGAFICKTEFITVQGDIKKVDSIISQDSDFKKLSEEADLHFVDFNCISDEEKPEIIIVNYKSDKGNFYISFDLLEEKIIDIK